MLEVRASLPDPLRIAVAPRRREILELIWDDELAVGEIAEHLPVSVPAVSQHLAKLRDAGLVHVRADGRRRYYRAARNELGALAEVLEPLIEGAAHRHAASAATTPTGATSPRTPTPATSPATPSSPATRLTPPPPTAPTADEGSASLEPTPAHRDPSPTQFVSARTQPRAIADDDPRLADDMASWYRQGLRARGVALTAARKALAEGASDGADSVRRLAGSLTRSVIAERFPEIAATATWVAQLDEADLGAGVDRLVGAIRQEAARDDPRVATILVVEDSKVEAALTRSILSGPNREILVTESADDAQRLIDDRDIDLILLDLGLAGSDGRDLLARLSRRPRTAGIPVILLTSRADARTRTEAMSLGADAYYTKPADSTVLNAAVAMMLERSAEVRHTGRQDPLTGLKNRGVFLEEARREAATAVRTKSDLSLVLLEIERLAAVNDFHGSEVGDRMVRALADAVRTTFRMSDVTARWGGSKLAILLSNTDRSGAGIALEKLRATTNAARLTLDDGTVLELAWRAGVASIRDHAGLDDAIARATRRLQIARRREGGVVASDEAVSVRARSCLLVEDDSILGDLIEHRLAREGFSVTRFADGSDALAAMANVNASAVVLDTMLPGADGFEVLRRLRESPAFAGVPIVVLTFGSDTDKRRAIELGANDALEKPFAVSELVTRVSRLAAAFEEGLLRG